MAERCPLVLGPAYLDFILELDSPLAPGASLILDQSLPALDTSPRDDGIVLLQSEHGDRLSLRLPPADKDFAATYHLAESVLARRLGVEAAPLQVMHDVSRMHVQVGGMGAGYALALDALLRMPLGHDAIAQQVLAHLDAHGIRSCPSYLPASPSDTSLVLLSPAGDKLAVGVRRAMHAWQANDEDRTLLAQASALVFCGAPNSLMAEILGWQPETPVMCAPAMRNVCDAAFPLAEMAEHIHYLALNALEWQHLPARERCREIIPLISITDGARGSRLLLRSGQEVAIPAFPVAHAINTNRAGETYGSTMLKVLLRHLPAFPRSGEISAGLVERAGHIAARQAARQLAIESFAFPPDDWMA